MSGTVVFVAGTSYSGSTFFHMMLGNDPGGFAVGELRWLFNPMRDHHPTMRCSCGDPSCDLWVRLRQGSDQNLFPDIFSIRDEVEFVVDSSKSVFWISRQAEHLRRRGFSVKHLLIWKTPQEIYASMEKRGRTADWETVWLKYHLLYFSLIRDWRAVPYSGLVTDPEVLKAACHWAGIPWFKGKEEYWNRTHHIFGGNKTSRFHLYDGANAEREISQTFDKDRMHLYRTINHTGATSEGPSLENLVSERQFEHARRVEMALHSRDVRGEGSSDSQLPIMRGAEILARRIKFEAEHALGRWRYRRRGS